jgi:S-adenosylmethionine synthetase
MEAFVTTPLVAGDEVVEVVERKGLGHPDTICDALAETLSRNLCREYRRRFGTILHHNVDKALLCGGRAMADFGGGNVLAPINIYLAGRATSEVGSDIIPLTEIAIEGSRAWLSAHLHALDPEQHVRIHNLIQPGSTDLQALFSRRPGLFLANDTSIGIGYAPMSALEHLVLALEKHMNMGSRHRDHAAWGEDIKVMGVRQGSTVRLTVACAIIGRHVRHLDDYLGEKALIKEAVETIVIQSGLEAGEIAINAADDPSTGSVYLTVTGTSAEAGDDGQVGRGNRVNGVIAPGRPMSLEAAAGKNPVTHVGKIYNVLAREIAEAVVREIPGVAAARCLLVSRIGTPINTPALLHLQLQTKDGLPVEQVRLSAEAIASSTLMRTSTLVDEFVDGTIDIY